MKLNKKLLIILILFVFLLFIGYKFYCYNIYKLKNDSELSSIKITGKMTINHQDLSENEYTTHNNMKFKNIFDGFERVSVESDAYALKDSNTNKAVLFGIDDQYINIIKTNNEYKWLYENVILKENIKDDIELLKYMEKYSGEVKFFMSTRSQKLIYSINEFNINMIPSIMDIKTVDGYYSGYMLKSSKDIMSVNILKDTKCYFFTFIGDYTIESINEFMNTVVIE